MIYYEKDNLIIRNMVEEDARIITEEEIKQGWHVSIQKYLDRLNHQKQGVCISLVACIENNPVGYINVYPSSIEGPTDLIRNPEIIDFGVLEKWRKNGIGSKLMDVAEEITSQYSDIVYLSVGLHCGYGAAQRMYAKRGYIPDGSGVWYKNQVCTPYTPCNNDDDLQIYMSKKLK